MIQTCLKIICLSRGTEITNLQRHHRFMLIGKPDTKMFKNDLFIKRNRNYQQTWATVVIFRKKTPLAVPSGKKYQRSGSGLRICLHVAETNSGQFWRMKRCILGMHFPVLEATQDQYMAEILSQRFAR